MNRIISFLVLAVLMASCAKPISDFSYKVEGKYAPAKVKFTNKSEKAETYTWEFGDGNTSVDESPEHIFTSSGEYKVKLLATKGTKVTAKEYTVVIDAPEDCLVEINTTHGKMVVQLYDATPKHRDNFIKLVEEGYFEDLLFHRVIDGFMIQGGDPDSRNAPPGKRLGMGGPSYKIPAEITDTLIHVKGALAAARDMNPQKSSSGSQFYIVHGRPVNAKEIVRSGKRKGINYTERELELYSRLGGTPQLDGGYTVFGMVIEGLEVIDKIAKVATDKSDRPKKDVKMNMKVIK